MSTPFSSIGILGLGLIGGSLAQALLKNAPELKIFGFDNNAESLKSAANILQATSSPMELAEKSQCLVLATPIGKYVTLLQNTIPHWQKNFHGEKFLTDVGSLQRPLLEATNNYSNINIVSSHPIAGSEKSGWEMANPLLFKQRLVLLSADKTTDISACKWLWEKTGAEIKTIDAKEHDQRYAALSHAPHLLIFAAAKNQQELLSLCKNYEQEEFIKHRLRLARSNIEMWQDITYENLISINNICVNYALQIEFFSSQLKARLLNSWKIEKQKIISENCQEGSIFSELPDSLKMWNALIALLVFSHRGNDHETLAGPAFKEITAIFNHNPPTTLSMKDIAAFQILTKLLYQSLLELIEIISTGKMRELGRWLNSIQIRF
jgi:prephenate dehydrogenase